MADKASIMRALRMAMGESGKTISDADRQRAMDRASMLEALESGPVKPMRRPNATSPRPRLRPQNIGGMRGGSTRGVNPAENYNAEDLMRLLKSAGVAGMKKGGAVKKKRTKKPKNGCTMQGRGGKYKGMK